MISFPTATEGNPDISRFEDSVFTGDYVCGKINKTYLKKIEKERADAAKEVSS